MVKNWLTCICSNRLNLTCQWQNSRVRVIKPLGYFAFLKLLAHAKKVLTDSGGVQKEAYMLKVPCITLRARTEWVETVSEGWNVLVDTSLEEIVHMATTFNPTGVRQDIFGKDACHRIVDIIDRISTKGS